MLNYTPMSVKDIPKLVSPFESTISENWDKSLIGAVLTKDKTSNSPLEKVMMGQ